MNAQNTSDEVTVVDRPEQHRYELRVDGEVRGLIVYSDAGDVRALVHTEVDEQVQGRGFAGKLAAQALQDIDDAGRRVSPACPYVEWYIEQHPEWSRLLAS